MATARPEWVQVETVSETGKAYFTDRLGNLLRDGYEIHSSGLTIDKYLSKTWWAILVKKGHMIVGDDTPKPAPLSFDQPQFDRY
jgi:hypothetical protein